VMSIFKDTPYALLIAARMVNVLLGTGMAYFIRRIARELFPNKAMGWMFTALVVFLPQNLFVFSYVNNDGMALFSASIIVYMWVLAAKKGWTNQICTGLGIGIGLLALSYYNAYGMILGSVIVFVCSFFYQKKQTFAFKDCMRIGFTIVGIVLVLAGWWFVRNAVLYEGDFLGFEANRRSAEIYAVDAYKPSMKVTLQNSGNPVWCLIVNVDFRFLLKQSFFARFGNMDLLAPNYIIRGFKIILFMGALGVLLPNKQKAFTGVKRAGFAIGMAVAAATAFVLTYWYSYANDYQPQGRYLLPGLIPLLCLTFMGIQSITRVIASVRIKERTVGKYAVWALYAGCFVYIAISSIGCVWLVWRQYYPQFSDTLHMIFSGGPI